MNAADLPDDSESSDEDYVPEATTAELPSEEESDGDVEDVLPDPEDFGKRGNKRQMKSRKLKKKRRIDLQNAATNEEKTNELKKVQEKEKLKTDDLWADFIKDTGFKTRAERLQDVSHTASLETTSCTNKPNEMKPNKAEPPKTVKVTEVYKFAGEEVKVEKEVPVDLLETASASKVYSSKSAGSGRLNSILNHLGKKPKITTLEKSKLDWEKFKKDEKIEDELQAYGKSKDGYLERQDFLERADLRRFEIEKEIRSNLRTNRMNNVNM